MINEMETTTWGLGLRSGDCVSQGLTDPKRNYIGALGYQLLVLASGVGSGHLAVCACGLLCPLDTDSEHPPAEASALAKNTQGDLEECHGAQLGPSCDLCAHAQAGLDIDQHERELGGRDRRPFRSRQSRWKACLEHLPGAFFPLVNIECALEG